MQYRIEVTLRDGKRWYVCDHRGRRPSYAAFSVEPSDLCTVAPNMKFAKEVRDAFRAYCATWGDLGYGKVKTVLRPVREVE